VSTKTEVSAEEYLHMTFEYDAEFVRGEIVQRGEPDNLHSQLQLLILLRLAELGQRQPVFPRPELRLKLAPNVYRIPDISVFGNEEPDEEVPSHPPLAVIEILSPDDRYSVLIEKLEEYRTWGVPHIWVVDGPNRRFSIYSEAGLESVSSLGIPQYSFEITASDLFSRASQV